MHPAEIASQAPDRLAVVMGDSGESLTFRELEERSRALAVAWHRAGVRRGDTVGILLENHLRFLEVAWAAQRSGLYYTAVNWHLTPEEVAYIVSDSGAKVLVSSRLNLSAAEAALAGAGADVGDGAGAEDPSGILKVLVDGTAEGWRGLDDLVAEVGHADLEDECEGDFMLYSSGTTGRPKGIRRPLTFRQMGQGVIGATGFLRLLEMQAGEVYLCPAPLYHAAPIAWSMGAQRLGSTVVVMERFDPEPALALIERHRVTHAQFVPTMFVRMLKLPPEARQGHDLSSLRAAVHAAAPCPVEVKQEMMRWWGPRIYEYYSSTEGVGATFIGPEDWLAHPGSVGRSIYGTPHVVNDDGNEVATGEIGTVYFEGSTPFEYHNDPEKTAATFDRHGWGSVGDMGYLDEEGYLYLTDRKTFMIISGGVNIYPQEIENLLIGHPKVLDVAVIGVPNPDLGEEVKAVVQPVDWSEAGAALEAELAQMCRDNLAGFKCPRSFDFDPELPRQENGKLYKRLLRDRYRAQAAG
ncbi:MAG TPA: acyl-CoA synthetase [Acidimicrobiales bacterium]|nr:acyl-CoA synthetase [Acidimicrobiales bacterium]